MFIALVCYICFGLWATASVFTVGLWAWLSIPESWRTGLITPNPKTQGNGPDADSGLPGQRESSPRSVMMPESRACSKTSGRIDS